VGPKIFTPAVPSPTLEEMGLDGGYGGRLEYEEAIYFASQFLDRVQYEQFTGMLLIQCNRSRNLLRVHIGSEPEGEFDFFSLSRVSPFNQ
jgi:hypothetical protein